MSTGTQPHLTASTSRGVHGAYPSVTRQYFAAHTMCGCSASFTCWLRHVMAISGSGCWWKYSETARRDR